MRRILQKVLGYWPGAMWALYAVGLCIVSTACSRATTEDEIAEERRVYNERAVSHIREIEYDGHEYLLYEYGRVYGITHKGGCKGCL